MKKFILTVLIAAIGLLLFYVLNLYVLNLPTRNLVLPPLSVEFEPTPAVAYESIATVRPNLNILKVARRGGLRFAPENTLPAIQQAIDLDMDYIELDVRYSSDGVPVLMHDSTVDRTTNGTGEVSKLSLKEIHNLDAGGWFHADFRGTPVPTLEAALRLMQGKACVLWDVKNAANPDAIKLFKTLEFDRDCLIVGFGAIHHSGKASKIQALILKLWPDAPIMPGIRTLNELRYVLAKYPQSRAVAISTRFLTDDLVDAAHAAGLLAYTTTLIQSDNWFGYQKVMDLGVDMLMLDNIDRFYQHMNIPVDLPEFYLQPIWKEKRRDSTQTDSPVEIPEP